MTSTLYVDALYLNLGFWDLSIHCISKVGSLVNTNMPFISFSFHLPPHYATTDYNICLPFLDGNLYAAVTGV